MTAYVLAAGLTLAAFGAVGIYHAAKRAEHKVVHVVKNGLFHRSIPKAK